MGKLLSTAFAASMLVAGGAWAQTPPPGHTGPVGSGTTANSPSALPSTADNPAEPPAAGAVKTPSTTTGTSGSSTMTPSTVAPPSALDATRQNSQTVSPGLTRQGTSVPMESGGSGSGGAGGGSGGAGGGAGGGSGGGSK